ncbi:phosphoenolpyruvate synthase [Granulosicoccaceae sp. 1_MG-2023]|nr:phosphoenolpyruvate synthase [Granulosicoccaceae sp. 1_MG-2023]
MQLTKQFGDITYSDAQLVGTKSASLGEIYQAMQGLEAKVPAGFAVTTDAYAHFMQENRLFDLIDEQLSGIDPADADALTYAGGKVRAGIIHSNMPDDLCGHIIAAYEELEALYGAKPDVAVRRSALPNDGKQGHMSAPQDSYLNVAGTRNLTATCKLVFASLFTDRAIARRIKAGQDHKDARIAVAVQKMVRSDQACSGVIYTHDTESGFADMVLISSAYGLGENVTNGAVNPDEFFVYKPTLDKGFRPLVKKQLGSKEIKMIYAPEQLAGVYTKNVPVHSSDRREFSLSDNEVLTLARYARQVESHYSALQGTPHPLEIEWAKDGYSGELFIVNARRKTLTERQDRVYETFKLREHGEAICTGRSVGRRIATGRARVILNTGDMDQLRDGEILITEKTDPEWEPVMRRAAAIITNLGGRTCHAAVMARELGIPALVGCKGATEQLRDGDKLTVNCADGDDGQVYTGVLPFDVQKILPDSLPQTRTKTYVNLGNPEQALEASFLPADGVGLARIEYILTSTIGIHPAALLNYDSLSRDLRNAIDEKTEGYPSPRAFYVDKLAQGIGLIAAAFYPRPVYVRFSDFKSSEYAALLGGNEFEPHEENPVIGLRGVQRYFSDSFSECFGLECLAINKVVKEMGLDNIQLLVPFVRSTHEAANVLELLARHDIKHGADGIRTHMMCEVPANALLAERFLAHFDGFSIGSNDLTQLALGVDREAGLDPELDERDEAPRMLMKMAIRACRKAGKHIGISGQAPSDFHDLVNFLVKEKIDAISFDQDALLRMKPVVAEAEK